MLSSDQPSPSTAAASAPDSEGSSAALPAARYEFEVGQRLRCDWRENEQRDCEVIARRGITDGAEGGPAVQSGPVQYYIHYTEFNRRLDEWVDADRLHKQEIAVRPVAERKRKLDPAVASYSGPPHALSHADEAAAGELDAATQREHEAATRVKNINKVVLGKWEIQTWLARAV